MPIEIQCMHCKRKIRVAEKFAGKHAKCPGCQGDIDIPALETTESTASTASDSDAKKKAAESKTGATSPAAKSSPSSKPAVAKPAAAGKEEWYLKTDDDAEYGPVTKVELDSWAEDGRIDSSCQLLRTGWEEWKWAEEVFPQFAEASGQTDTAAAKAPAQAEPEGFDLDAITGGGGGGEHDNSIDDLDFTSEPSKPILSSKSKTSSRPQSISRHTASEPILEPEGEGAGLSRIAQKALAETHPWTKFVSILLFVGAGFAALGGLGLALLALLSIATNPVGLIMLVPALIYLAAAGGYGFAGYQLFRFSTLVQKFLRQKKMADLEGALISQKTFWKFVGIITAAMLIISVLMAIGMVVVGGLAGMAANAPRHR